MGVISGSGTKVEVWDETTGSNDGEDSEPENVAHHEGEEIQRIGCVYQKIDLQRHWLSLPLMIAARAHAALGAVLSVDAQPAICERAG